MKRLLLILLLLCSTVVSAADLKPADADLIAAAGVPLYSKATFVYGNADVGFRFAAGVSPDEARQWYKEKLARWSLMDQYGSWILYDGAPGLGMGAMMSKNQVMVQKNQDLPKWYSLDQRMTTEIVIMIGAK